MTRKDHFHFHSKHVRVIDKDDECAGPLVCELRDAKEAVPGCLGEGLSGKDYCRIPDITLEPTMSLVPTEAQPTESPTITVVPPTESPTITASPTSLLPLVIVGDNGSPSELFPLRRCEGDCDTDDECSVRTLLPSHQSDINCIHHVSYPF